MSFRCIPDVMRFLDQMNRHDISLKDRQRQLHFHRIHWDKSTRMLIEAIIHVFTNPGLHKMFLSNSFSTTYSKCLKVKYFPLVG